MPRTSLLNAIAELAGTVRSQRNDREPRGPSRRTFLRAATVAAASPLLQANNAPRIAVVGAGLAGLTCAYRLRQAGFSPVVYEARDRVGGRCWTLRGAFAEEQIVERGGELIDQSHTAIRQLAQEFKLPLDNLLRAERNGTEPLGYFDNAPYTWEEAGRELKSIWKKIHRDISEASYPTTYLQSTARGRELDAMSIVDWINESVPGGTGSRLGQLLDVAYNIEYGAESTEQSALNLLYLLGYSGQGQLRIFGPSNEKYHVRGGNDQIVNALASNLQGQIRINHALKAIRLRPDGVYALEFQTPSGSIEVLADRVVLALPFSILRQSVDFSQAGFRPLKSTAIQQQGVGANAKLHLQFNTRHWETLGSNGETFSDTGYQCTWEVSRAQPGEHGILVDYTGGNTARAMNQGSLQHRAQVFLSQLEPVLPMISAQWNGLAQLQDWPRDPWMRGSYSFWKVGQYTLFAGIEGEREGNCHFCGEHTSVDFQGYLNGAVETGERAAAEIRADF